MSCWRHDWQYIGNGNECCSRCGELRRWTPFYERHYGGLVFFSLVAVLILSVVTKIIMGS